MLRQNRGLKSFLGSHPEKGNRSKHGWEGCAFRLQDRASSLLDPKEKVWTKDYLSEESHNEQKMLRLFTTGLCNNWIKDK